MFKNMRLVSPIWLELQLAQVNLNPRNYSKSSGTGSLNEKRLFDFE